MKRPGDGPNLPRADWNLREPGTAVYCPDGLQRVKDLE